MNDNYNGTNQDPSDSSSTYGPSPYQDPNQQPERPYQQNSASPYGQPNTPYGPEQPYNNQQTYGQQQSNTYDDEEEEYTQQLDQFNSNNGYGQQNYSYNNQNGYGYQQTPNYNQMNYQSQQTPQNSQSNYNQSQNFGYSNPEASNNGQPNYNSQQPTYSSYYNQPDSNKQNTNQANTNQSYSNNNYTPNNNGNGPAYGSMNDSYLYSGYSNNDNMNTVKATTKKSHKWLWGFSVIPVLAIAAVLCFLFIPSFKNFIYKHALGTTKYYEHIESSCTEKVKDELTDLPKGKKLDAKKGISNSGEISFDLNEAFAQKIGINPNDFTCNYSTNSKDKKGIMNYKINFKGTELAALELYSDAASGKLFIKVPGISDKYIDYAALISKLPSSDSSKIKSELQSKIKNLSTAALSKSPASTESLKTLEKIVAQLDPDTVSKISKDYTKFIADKMGDKGAIKLKENQKLQAGSLEQSCEEFTVTLTQAQFCDITVDVLKKAKEDQRILDIVKNALGDTSSFTQSIDQIISEKPNPDELDKDSSLQMLVYTDGQQILGRKFVVKDGTDDYSVSYAMLTTKKHTTFALKIGPSGDSDVFSVTLDSKKSGDKSNGTLEVQTKKDTYTMNFSDFKWNTDRTIEGKFTLDLPSMSSVTLDLSSKDGKQVVKLGAKGAGQDLGSMTLQNSTEELKDFNYPDIPQDKVVTLTDNASLAAYLKDSNFSKFVDNIFKTLNIKVDANTFTQSLISRLEGGSSALPDSNDPDSADPDSADPGTNNGAGSNDNNNNNNNNGTNGSTNPSDYNLPSDAKIDEYGYYDYNLTDSQLADMKKKGSEYKNLGKTFDQIKSYTESLAKTMCGKDCTTDSETKNKVTGKVKSDYKRIYHCITNSWIGYAADEVVEVTYDSLDNKMLVFHISSKDSGKLMQRIKDTYGQLGLKAIPAATEKEISGIISAKKKVLKDYTLGDSHLDIYVSNYSNDVSYSVYISKDGQHY